MSRHHKGVVCRLGETVMNEDAHIVQDHLRIGAVMPAHTPESCLPMSHYS